jgi:ABC-type amino acid transport substrate-binding protein
MRNSKTLLAVLGTLAATAVMSACGDGGGINGVADLEGKVVGVQKETTSEDYAKHKTGAAQVRTFADIGKAFDALAGGEVDAVINDFPSSQDALKTRRELKIVATIPTGEVYGFALPKGSPLLATVNGALATIKQDGTYAEIYSKWFGMDPPASILKSKEAPLTESAPPGTFRTKGGRDTLLVGSDVPYTPFEFGSGPDYQGFDIDVIRAIAQDVGLKVKFTDTPFETIFDDLAAGKFDMVASATTITPARAKLVAFSEPYFPADQSLVVRK